MFILLQTYLQKAASPTPEKPVTISRNQAATEQARTRLPSDGQESKSPRLPERVSEVTEGRPLGGEDNHKQR
jgi:hypothetical protein